MANSNGYDEHQLLTFGGISFVVKVIGAWKDRRYFEKKDFTDDIKLILEKHHRETEVKRLDNMSNGEEENNE